MPGLSEPTDAISASWRKRKRDHEDSDVLGRPPPFVPHHIDYPEYTATLPLPRHPADGGDMSCRPRCLPRKRRHVQPPYLSLPTPQQSNLLSPNVYASPQDPYSPPVSPKTIVPLSYPSTSPSALRPCHICHRRPTTRQVLDAYADCDLCSQRACFICLRQCDALDCAGSVNSHLADYDKPNLYDLGHALDQETILRRKICSSCAVEGLTETGTETVRCLDCVRSHSAPWPAGPLAAPWALDEMNHESTA